MDETCPTVKVKNPAAPGSFVVINESDFDASVHELFDAPAPEAPAPDEAAPKSKRGT